MSVENLKEYARRCANDPELRAKANAFGLTNLHEHMREAEAMGLEWTLDDMRAFSREVADAQGDIQDLDEEDLEQISGGVVTATAAVAIVVVVGVGVVATGAAVMATTGGKDW